MDKNKMDKNESRSKHLNATQSPGGLVDSHCHLHLLNYEELNNDMDSVVQLARSSGVVHMLCVGTTLEDIPVLKKIAEKYEDVTMSIGLHPNETADKEPTLEELIKLAESPKIVAIGETGLDYYRTEASMDWQKERFRTHIRAAKWCRKPLIIHTRQAKEDTLAILKEERADEIGGVFHCFTEDWEMANRALDMNFLISFSGIVTFKNAIDLQEVAKKVPLEKMIIETDCPYLAPVPYRGKINQPAYVKYVAAFLAQLKQVSYEELAHRTTENYFSVFGIL